MANDISDLDSYFKLPPPDVDKPPQNLLVCYKEACHRKAREAGFQRYGGDRTIKD